MREAVRAFFDSIKDWEKHPFCGLAKDPDSLHALLSGYDLELIKVPAGQALFCRWDVLDAVYLHVRGKVAVEIIPGWSRINSPRPIRMYGELAYFQPPRHHSIGTVAALENCSFIKIPYPVFTALLEDHPKFAQRLAESSARSAMHFVHALTRTLNSSPEDKLYEYLCEKARHSGNRDVNLPYRDQRRFLEKSYDGASAERTACARLVAQMLKKYPAVERLGIRPSIFRIHETAGQASLR